MQILSSNDPGGPWEQVCDLFPAHSSSKIQNIEEFYLISHRFSLKETNDIFEPNLSKCNISLLTLSLLLIEDLKFLVVHLWGTADPLSASRIIETDVETMPNGILGVRIKWFYEGNLSPPGGFKVVYFANSSGLGSGGFEVTVGGSDRATFISGLLRNVKYVFLVFALNKDGDEGIPSEKSQPICMKATESELLLINLHLSNNDFLSLAETGSVSSVSKTSSNHRASVENLLSLSSSAKLTKDTILESTLLKRKEEQQLLTKSVLGKKGSSVSIEEYANNFTQKLHKTMRGMFEEVNYLMENAFPVINSFCQYLGITFSVVDLRWGIRDTMTDDHMTIDICLSEIDRCRNISTGMSFLFISGERYGWRALPNKVSVDEFKSILSILPPGDGLDTFISWYRFDSNSLDFPYVLQKPSVMRGRVDVKYNHFWKDRDDVLSQGAESIIQTTVRKAIQANISLFSDSVMRNWNISVTEREVMHGLYIENNDENTEIGGLVLMRTINGLEDEVNKIMLLRTRIIRPWKMIEIYLMTYDLELKHNAAMASGLESSQYLGVMVVFHLRSIQATITEEVQVGVKKRAKLSSLQKECLHHHSFAYERSKSFYGRDDVKNRLSQLIHDEKQDAIVRCVYGVSGAGKTSAMAEAAVSLRQYVSESTIIIFRACGTSADSSCARDIMRSICDQICECLNKPIEACSGFEDQLSNLDQGRTQPWRWLPRMYNQGISFIQRE
eukprot:gene12974-17399_t